MYQGEFLVVTVRSTPNKKDASKTNHYGELSDGRAVLPCSFDEAIAGTLPQFGQRVVCEFELWVYNRGINMTVKSWLPVPGEATAAEKAPAK